MLPGVRPDATDGWDQAGMTCVAMLAPIAWPTPPRRYGTWEQVVATLTDALIDLGVERQEQRPGQRRQQDGSRGPSREARPW